MGAIERPDLSVSSLAGQNIVVASGIGNVPSTTALEALQTLEQRQVLDTVSDLRRCGLDNVLSLPQLVVCGDQSAGKSSVLEALTEIPFPRKDNLCTRFPTEIILRRGVTENLRIRIIPDRKRSAEERAALNDFHETVVDLRDLPEIMSKATSAMGLEDSQASNGLRRAFAMDVLIVEIEGPTRPQLTVVDLPGIIQAETKDASQADVDMTVEITKSYISSPRTICLAVISAANDYANQPILNLVRQYDPKGERTLGIITKPDRLPAGSETESSFFDLASNEDIVFDLGWHMLKNRTFEEVAFSISERNVSEELYFRDSVFRRLGPNSVGIQALVTRLSRLLFTHIHQELPRLHTDLEEALSQARSELGAIGRARTNAGECRSYLTELSLGFHEVCKAAVNGYYEGEYFRVDKEQVLQKNSSDSIRRLRAVVQLRNKIFSDEIRLNGHKFHVVSAEVDNQAASIQPALDQGVEEGDGQSCSEEIPAKEPGPFSHIEAPEKVTHDDAIHWVNGAVTRARGRELPGNFNPLVIAELFWEQSSKWHHFGVAHISQISELCRTFLESLLRDKCPHDILLRLWPKIQDWVRARRRLATEELEKILEETRSYPINYNHYYTDTIKKRQVERRKAELERCLEHATQHVDMPGCSSDHTFPSVNVSLAMKVYSERMDPDMDTHSSELVLDCLRAVYKLLDADILGIAAEPESTKKEREVLTEKVRMLTEGQLILSELMSSLSC
ncbi:P-loop containing nucleoside triphosphate hydrolase protein [Penicillium nucicola]|uniref:P-loop containing nucleoside triphosphate hydrolase protein n=1 Tax=Penicillium nucicola TaxID=1850975 RepID=UPI002544F57F|nr:P-loop containing nucleoside triphosphate hydrolase protein [Penicillium nucicola]KAJ5742529.1 P-loop containing nucleoside triphosphate hydrolase protein [Penicillium nucicola]